MTIHSAHAITLRSYDDAPSRANAREPAVKNNLTGRVYEWTSKKVLLYFLYH